MTDSYTRGILTVIAAALVVLVFQNAVGRVNAQSDRLQKVQLCDESGCVGVTPYTVKVGTQTLRLNSLDVNMRPN